MENTINQVFYNRVQKYGDRLAVEKKRNGVWETATWNQYYERARAAGLGFYELGVRHGDRICILSENCLEWVYSDLGGLGIGAAVVPIYPTVPAAEVAYIVNNCKAKVLVVENRVQLDKSLEVAADCPSLEALVVITEEVSVSGDVNVLSFATLQERGRARHNNEPELFHQLATAVEADDLLTIQYTSGTTGVPKGAIHTHRTIMAQIHYLDAVSPPYGYDSDNCVGFLPLSHIFERVPVHFYLMFKGITKSYAESINTIGDDIREKKPTILFGVPRIHEKIYSRMTMAIKEKPALVQKLFAWAQKVGDQVSVYKQRKQPLPAVLKLKYRLAFALVFKKLQETLGGRVRWFCAAGGPIATEIVNFFNAAGIFVLEGYGMSESAGGITLSTLDNFYPGSVGVPLPGYDLKIADDGEILVKGDCIFKGYWNMPEITAEAFTEDGYFHTGDIGHFNDDGLLFITDRKKDLIITAGGKNVAPQKIETLFRNNPLFAHCVVIGDRRKYLTALFNLNPDIALQLALEKGLGAVSFDQLVEDPDFLGLVNEKVAAINRELGRFETIKKFRIVKNEFSIENGELTPSLKVKRKLVAEKYRTLIEEMYDGSGNTF